MTSRLACVLLLTSLAACGGDDNNSKIMPEIAKHLGDNDIAALASYVEGLHSAAADAKATAAR